MYTITNSPLLVCRFGSSAYDSRLAEENIGHQMLKRMGWEGAGLGSKQQGLQEPVKSGDVRDKTDKYKVRHQPTVH